MDLLAEIVEALLSGGTRSVDKPAWMLGDLVSRLSNGLMELIMACYAGLWGILTGLTQSTNHPSGIKGTLTLGMCYHITVDCLEYGTRIVGTVMVLETSWEGGPMERGLLIE